MSESELFTVKKASSSYSSSHQKEEKILRRHTTFALNKPKHSKPKKLRTVKRLKKRSAEKWEFKCLKNKAFDQFSSSRSTSNYWTSTSSSSGSRKHRTPEILPSGMKLKKKPPLKIKEKHLTLLESKGRKSAAKELHPIGTESIHGVSVSKKLLSSSDKSIHRQDAPKEPRACSSESIYSPPKKPHSSGDGFIHGEGSPKEPHSSGAGFIHGEGSPKESYLSGDDRSIHEDGAKDRQILGEESSLEENMKNLSTAIQQIGVLEQRPLYFKKLKDSTSHKTISIKQPDISQSPETSKDCKPDSRMHTEGNETHTLITKRQTLTSNATMGNTSSEKSTRKVASHQDITPDIPPCFDHSLVGGDNEASKEKDPISSDKDMQDETPTVYEELCKSHDIF